MGRVEIRIGVVQVVVAGVMLTLPTAGGFTTTSSQSRDIAGKITCRRFLKYIKRSCMSWRRDVTRVELSFHRDTVSKFRANRYLFLYLKTASLAEERAANANFLVFDLTQSGLYPMIFHTHNHLCIPYYETWHDIALLKPRSLPSIVSCFTRFTISWKITPSSKLCMLT